MQRSPGSYEEMTASTAALLAEALGFARLDLKAAGSVTPDMDDAGRSLRKPQRWQRQVRSHPPPRIESTPSHENYAGHPSKERERDRQPSIGLRASAKSDTDTLAKNVWYPPHKLHATHMIAFLILSLPRPLTGRERTCEAGVQVSFPVGGALSGPVSWGCFQLCPPPKLGRHPSGWPQAGHIPCLCFVAPSWNQAVLKS